MRARQGLGRWPLGGFFGVLLVVVAMRAWAAEDAALARLRQDVAFLASDECEGRGPGTAGINKAAEYIVAQFKAAGLKPAGPGGSYYQPFTIAGPGQLEEGNFLRLHGPQGQTLELEPNQDFTVLGLSGAGKVTAPLVFAGYGATASDIGYDDYKGLDVAGKVVIVLRRTPRWGNEHAPFDGDNKEYHASLENKLANAELHKAAAVLLVNDATKQAEGEKLLDFDDLAAGGGSAIPAMHIRYDLVDRLLRSSLGTGLRDVGQALDRDLQPRSSLLREWTVTLVANVRRQTQPVKNIIGILEGAGPLAGETIVVGAHYDHLGFGGRSSRSKAPDVKAIHHGADDNASGTAALLELARRFAQTPNRQGRRLVFLAFSAEERGLLGSRYYCNREPLVPLADTAAMVNLDMVGRLRQDPKANKDKLYADGIGTGKNFEELLDEVNKKYDFKLVKKRGGTGPSDHDSFYRRRVPIFYFWTGYHADYHRPGDTADKINVAGMKRITSLIEDLVGRLAELTPRPEYARVASTFQPVSGGKSGPRLGIMPSYDEDDEPGLLVDGVSEGGPADKAGLIEGDRIVEIAGQPVTNIRTYMVLMAQQQRGRPLEIRILREGKKQSFQVTPQ